MTILWQFSLVRRPGRAMQHLFRGEVTNLCMVFVWLYVVCNQIRSVSHKKTANLSSHLLPNPPNMAGQSLWLRCEKKEFERRAALTPKIAQKLIEAGFQISVERDKQRIFDDEEFEKLPVYLPARLVKLTTDQGWLYPGSQQYVAQCTC
jgi:hypothetical protein